jgi:hypothetical protein
MVIPPLVQLGGVRIGDGLGAGSLILIPGVLLLKTFLPFLEADRVAVTLHLPARVLEDPTLGPFDDMLVDSTLIVWAKKGTPGIGVSPSKPCMGAMKLSNACRQALQK